MLTEFLPSHYKDLWADFSEWVTKPFELLNSGRFWTFLPSNGPVVRSKGLNLVLDYMEDALYK